MIPTTIIEAIGILTASFAVVLIAVQVLPKENTNVVKLKPRQPVHRSYKKVRKAS
jgi:hypothetical protein